MASLVLSIAVFVLAHLVPALPGMRDRLVARYGRTTYLAVYSTVSLGLFAWMVHAAVNAPAVRIWDPAPWQALVPLVATPVAAVLLAAGLATPNPLSISLLPGERPGAMVALARHPVPLAFLLWSAAHIPPNGTATALIFFGAMALFSLMGMALLDRRKRAALGDRRWRAMAARAPVVPFTRLPPSGVGLGRVAAAALVGLAVWAWFLLDGHQRLIGRDPLGLLR